MALTTSSYATVQAFLSPLQRAVYRSGSEKDLPLFSATSLEQDMIAGDLPDHLADLVSRDFDLQTPQADVIDLQEGQRLVCLGDVHGDAQALRDMLQVAGVIERSDNLSDGIEWTGGNTILVQNGDILDRGDSELSCWKLLARLSHQAVQQGGAVIVLWGNHEAMNCEGQFHYTTGDTEYQEMISQSFYDVDLNEKVSNTNTGSLVDLWTVPSRIQPAREATYKPGTGLLVAPLLSKLKVAVKVGRTLCVHAGLTSRHLDEYGGLAGMNRQARDWVQGGFGSGGLPECLIGSNGPVWMRDYSYPCDVEPLDPQAQKRLDSALFVAGADRMVVGHTVQSMGINAALNNKVWRVDVGASRGVMSGTPEVLEVTKQNGREVVSVLTSHEGRLAGSERQARPQGFVERVAQAVTDTVTVPVAEAVMGIDFDK